MSLEVTLDIKLMTEEYEYLVKIFSELDISLEIPNRHIDHAATLTKYIFNKATKNVYIFSGGLPEIFIDKIRENIKAALKRKVEVTIIVLDCTQCATSESVIDFSSFKNFKLYKVNDDMTTEVKKGINHFCVSDSKMFRLEEFHPDKDFTKNPEIKAKANYNSPKLAKALTDKFNELLLVSKKIELI